MGLALLFGPFIAGIVPGVMMCICLGIVAYVIAIKRGFPAETFPGFRSLAISTVVALPGLMTAVIIVGGVLSGVMTVTESGAFGAIWAVLATIFVYRELTWDKFRAAVVTSVRTTTLVMLLVATASAFSYLLALCRVPALPAGAGLRSCACRTWPILARPARARSWCPAISPTARR
ncbi:trap dicarboxylate transporter- dctm subunit [Citreicella sp. SE45]|nr:trap dicarboxylate transporter- dctm subunit [Citreicella sp. SE45]